MSAQKQGSSFAVKDKNGRNHHHSDGLAQRVFTPAQPEAVPRRGD
jgi:hypothetical protein